MTKTALETDYDARTAGPIEIRPIRGDDLTFIRSEQARHWICSEIWSRGVKFQADQLPGFIAMLNGRPVGHVTFFHGENETEVITLSATIENHGIGTAILSTAVERSRARGDRRIFLTTSNDNIRALAFYQKRLWRIVRIWRGLIGRYREMDKRIPRLSAHGIPIHDEIELELPLVEAMLDAQPCTKDVDDCGRR